MKKTVAPLITLALILAIQITETQAAWGDLDPSFGYYGIAFDTVMNHVPRSVAFQPDGKILVAGYRTSTGTGDRMFLRRYLVDGTLNVSFGDDGAAEGYPEGTPNSVYRGDSIVVLPNGKIAVAGYANGNYAVWQFTADGVADSTFGTFGLKVLSEYPVGVSSATPEINVQNSRILLTIRREIAGDLRVLMVRLTSTGAYDTAFGTNGYSLTELDGTLKGYDGTQVEANGRITVGGFKYFDRSAKTMERKLANGDPDTSFDPPTHSTFGLISPGLVRMANGKYAMRGAVPSNNPFPRAPFAEKWGSTGVFEAAQDPVTGYPSGNCPEIFKSEKSGRLLIHLSSYLYRMNSELHPISVETIACSNLAVLTSKSRAALQKDDKMVLAGLYSGTLVLARTLGN